MSRSEKAILWGTGLLVVLTMLLDTLAPREPDWRRSFSRYRNDPYACAMVYGRLKDFFPKGVRTLRQSLYETGLERAEEADAPPATHMFIDQSFGADSLGVASLLAMVEAGDDAFIAAEWYTEWLTGESGVQTASHWDMPAVEDAFPVNKEMPFARPDTLHFTAAPLRTGTPSVFVRGDMTTYFSRLPGDTALVLATNQRGQPVLVRLRHGQGRLYLCTVPLAFTNYYLLKDEARPFMAGVFNLLPDRPVLWDEFSKAGREGSRTPLRYILSQPALKAAYWAAVALLLLTIVVHARRRQRAIPVVAPPRNTSRDFAETIARLYYFRGDHADLARKLSAQFREEVRRRLRLHGTTWDAATVREIALRTGIREGELDHAQRLMEHLGSAEHVTEEQLLRLNRALRQIRTRL